jgi:DNA-directed RNA polymerase subunit RPC12/RpoP
MKQELTSSRQMRNDGERNDKQYHCSICGREISEEDFEDFDGMCWECWDDQLTEESEDMFGDVM